MSVQPLHCTTCDRECVYDRCAPFGEAQETVYAVAWRCPEGHGGSVDVCPVGPLVPSRELCLNCGARYPSDAADALCGCGLSRTACPAALGIADKSAEDPIGASRSAFAKGLFRHGLAILNQDLQERSGLLEAWFLKARFLNSVGFNRSAAEMIGCALEKLASPSERIGLLEEQSFLWAECERGTEALSSAEAAAEFGSKSIRTHYLRGRALALLGRLEEARNEMDQVLVLDSNNADALRSLKMIDAAIRPKQDKRWWQFWKP